MNKLKLSATGFLQVVLVAFNTYMIATGNWIAVPVISFLISFVWSWNIRKIAFGDFWDRVVYSLGAALGGLSGLWLGVLLS